MKKIKIKTIDDFTENKKLHMLNFCLKPENKALSIKEKA